jgi:hypothetical protein
MALFSKRFRDLRLLPCERRAKPVLLLNWWISLVIPFQSGPPTGIDWAARAAQRQGNSKRKGSAAKASRAVVAK